MDKIWKVKACNKELAKELAESVEISLVTAQVLINRGISTQEEAERFLRCDIRDLHSPLELKGLVRAVARIKQALSSKERIMVHGDYDVDGVTGVALLVEGLRRMGAEVFPYIPCRLGEGYGVSEDAVSDAKEKRVSLVITVDCGIGAYQEVELFNAEGMDVIVTDHHEPREELLPRAYSIINPHQEGCGYPYKDLAGVGIAFKLLTAIGRISLAELLDLTALGTVADVAPLTGENRIIVKFGLGVIAASKRVGIKAFLDVVKLAGKRLLPWHIGFILGPRINASGRIGSAYGALDMLMASSYDEAFMLAKRLEKDNRTRQRIGDETFRAALVRAEEWVKKEHKVLVVDGEGWHPGVIGIVASRLAERFSRPSIVVSTDTAFAQGSGRSIRTFPLFDALVKCKDYLLEYGGHEYACGVKLPKENLSGFRKAINVLAEDMLTDEDMVPVIDADMEVSFADLNGSLFKELELLEPHGQGNQAPLFISRNLELRGAPQVVGNNHLKAWFTDGDRTFEAIGFGMANRMGSIMAAKSVDLLYTPTINEWADTRNVQLKVKDFKSSF